MPLIPSSLHLAQWIPWVPAAGLLQAASTLQTWGHAEADSAWRLRQQSLTEADTSQLLPLTCLPLTFTSPGGAPACRRVRSAWQSCCHVCRKRAPSGRTPHITCSQEPDPPGHPSISSRTLLAGWEGCK